MHVTDFTIDMWVKHAKMTAAPFYLSVISTYGGGRAKKPTDQLAVGIGGIWKQHLAFATPKLKAKTKLGVYYRFTFSRKGNLYSMYVDGKLHLQKRGPWWRVFYKAAKWVLGQEQDKLLGGFDKNQRFIGDICEFRMWNKGLTKINAKKFFQNINSMGKPTLFNYPASFKYTLKNGAKGPGGSFIYYN